MAASYLSTLFFHREFHIIMVSEHKLQEALQEAGSTTLTSTKTRVRTTTTTIATHQNRTRNCTSNANIELRTTPMIRTEPNRMNRVKGHPRWFKIQGISYWQRSTDANWKSEAQRTINERSSDVKGQRISTTARYDMPPLEQQWLNWMQRKQGLKQQRWEHFYLIRTEWHLNWLTFKMMHDEKRGSIA